MKLGVYKDEGWCWHNIMDPSGSKARQCDSLYHCSLLMLCIHFYPFKSQCIININTFALFYCSIFFWILVSSLFPFNSCVFSCKFRSTSFIFNCTIFSWIFVSALLPFLFFPKYQCQPLSPLVKRLYFTRSYCWGY